MNRMHHQKTNQQVVREIMAFSRYGALAEVFVMNAVIEASERIAKMDPESVPRSAMINPQAWIGVAQEIKGKLDRHYGHAEPERAAA
jgi:hypothetical protein